MQIRDWRLGKEKTAGNAKSVTSGFFVVENILCSEKIDAACVGCSVIGQRLHQPREPCGCDNNRIPPKRAVGSLGNKKHRLT
jgi:hypothetical protein